uniref:Long-chain-alcohol oxidase n=1 Tax=Araucaria cunninghamii TaxID=56994 RepID=A0A0D6QT97_ARACU
MEDAHKIRLLSPSKAKEQGHPMLRGGRKAPCTHGFSAAEIKSLGVLCDTFIPSVSRENLLERDPEIESFYLLHGSQNGIPEQVAKKISSLLRPSDVAVARWVLWLLDTRVGTWMLCGSTSLKPQFPYLQTFAEISRSKREQILLEWSRGKRFALLKSVFKLFKIFILFIFYSTTDENGQNPAWKPIGYSPPDLNSHVPASIRPLEKGVIDLTSGGEDLPSLFEGTGFSVTKEEVNVTNFAGLRNWRVECDAVVVGSGCGGGVAAGILAQAGYRVIVLEKGKYFARDDLTLREGPSMENMYESEGLLSSNDGNFFILAGSTVGGGSAVNWSASIPTPPHVLNQWATRHGLPLFATEEYQCGMKTVCERLGVQDRCSKESFQNTVMRKGCEKLGYSVDNVARNSTADHFCGSCCFGCRSGNKKGTNQTWLVDAVRAGAAVLAGCRAEKVLCVPAGGKRKKALGVVASLCGDGGRIVVHARVTVVAGGALHTPPLLRASGLRNPNIGRNLRLHPVQLAWGYFPEGKEPEGTSYEGGIITAMCKDGAGYDGSTSGYGTILQTPAAFPGMFAALIPWTSGADMKDRMCRYARTAHVFALARDSGGGSVMRYRDIHYRLADVDREKVAEGLRKAVRILIAAGATEVGTHRSDGQRFVAEGATEDEIEDFVSNVAPAKGSASLWTTTCTAHQMGSCRMGKDEKSGAVDWKGESWEVEGLFVCDGSLLPTAVGVNPMITIQSVAFCVSKYILDFLRKDGTGQ